MDQDTLLRRLAKSAREKVGQAEEEKEVRLEKAIAEIKANPGISVQAVAIEFVMSSDRLNLKLARSPSMMAAKAEHEAQMHEALEKAEQDLVDKKVTAFHDSFYRLVDAVLLPRSPSYEIATSSW